MVQCWMKGVAHVGDCPGMYLQRLKKDVKSFSHNVLAGIRTQHLPNTSVERHRYTNLLSAIWCRECVPALMHAHRKKVII